MMISIQRSATFNFVLLFLAISLHRITSTIYYVIPDDVSSSHYDRYDREEDSFSLQHYLNNTSQYFVSHNQLHFTSGHYHINNVLIFKDINNFSVIGIDRCVIMCTSPASIVIVNASNVTIHNINLINCTKHHKDYFNVTHFNSLYAKRSVPSFSVKSQIIIHLCFYTIAVQLPYIT